jgi:hypothetical protein
MEPEKIGRIKRNAPTASLPLPLIGKIKIGEKKEGKGGREYPVSLDYFKATGDYAQMFFNEFGDKPNRIQIIFATDDNRHSCLEEYDARDPEGRRAGYGNGVDIYLFEANEQHPEKGEYKKYNADNDKAYIKNYTAEHKLKWSVVLTLHFIIPAIRGVFGLWRFQTRGSKSSIGQIVQAFDNVKEAAGTIINIPFDISVAKVKSQKPGSKSVFPVVSLIPNIGTDNLELVHNYLKQGGDIRKAGMLSGEKIELLEAPKKEE